MAVRATGHPRGEHRIGRSQETRHCLKLAVWRRGLTLPSRAASRSIRLAREERRRTFVGAWRRHSRDFSCRASCMGPISNSGHKPIRPAPPEGSMPDAAPLRTPRNFPPPHARPPRGSSRAWYSAPDQSSDEEAADRLWAQPVARIRDVHFGATTVEKATSAACPRFPSTRLEATISQRGTMGRGSLPIFGLAIKTVAAFHRFRFSPRREEASNQNGKHHLSGAHHSVF